MTDEIAKDPAFRTQYECGVPEDREFEAAVSASPQPRLSMPAAPQPLAGSIGPQGFVRLR